MSSSTLQPDIRLPPLTNPQHQNSHMSYFQVCVGLLTVTALVLYPVPYLQPQMQSSNPDQDWAPIRLSYEHNATKPGGQETIHIRTPTITLPSGEVAGAENFAVVEQKVATYLGPMLGKGLIRLDGKVRRGIPNLPILPLQLLVFTPKGNIPVVSGYLQQSGLLLDHPTLPSDLQRLHGQHYHNPHNPPPGGHRAAMVTVVPGKSVEVQRSQVDQLFKSLKDGDELEETEPPPEVATTLYPHQKKALTFLLERERERCGPDGIPSSLWREAINPLSNQRSWVHIVTQREQFESPNESKGAILADDMGLGKTITCVSLIAATLNSAKAFATTALSVPPLTPSSSQQDNDLTAAHFQGSVWGMQAVAPPPPPPPHTSQKAKAKQAREQDKADAEYARACRIKVNSRATLIICPLSTVMNWEDQFREHWRGEVTVVGGGGISCNLAAASASQTPGTSTPCSQETDVKPVVAPKSVARIREGTPLRVYVYHGTSRKPDPSFLADFDAVITTYSTLATEFSKQNKSLCEEEEEAEASDGFVEVDEQGNSILKPSKGKKAAKRKKPGCRQEMPSPLQSVNWFRVVLDEAHSIKETSTVACRACCDLFADRRLCLTGTPVQNKLDDVYALIKFLRLSPFDDKAIWTEFIGTPVKYSQPIGVARLQTIMKCITLRRTKESKAENGQKILALPARRDELRYLKFDEQEQAIYDQFFTESKAEFKELSNKNEVMKNYVGILQKILRLRQICDHFELVKNKGLGLLGDTQVPSYEELAATIAEQGIDQARGVALFAFLREAGTAQCVECGHELGTVDTAQADVGCALSDGDLPPGSAKRSRKPKAGPSASRNSTRQNSPTPALCVLTRCQHLFCAGCWRTSCCPGPNAPPDARGTCSICQASLPSWDVVEVNPEFQVAGPDSSKKKSARKEKRQRGVMSMEDFHPSTKVRALIGDLLPFSRANPHSANYDPESIEIQMIDDSGHIVEEGITKTVVFSQWTTMLDKVEDALEAANIRFDRLDGTMRRDERTRAMDALKYDPGCEVLLVSLKAGGVGLNLTAAQRVYLMDPYWNPAVENQAVDRIHRLGQTRPVTTVKLIIENTIEARLLEVQKKKTELANLTLGQSYTKAEVLQRRMEELNQLFGG
ncbi:hypothetical protein EUX98_g728 [Antrodiella citrinella]|uniref:Uncharacterized protein n=1 Tax=Antrodiella citrinella TaxID=2447956 RepID=A0A4S4N387_9APHY|nr:hypothetical protein EUX98_g728 [Antrodiella citrinella]